MPNDLLGFLMYYRINDYALLADHHAQACNNEVAIKNIMQTKFYVKSVVFIKQSLNKLLETGKTVVNTITVFITNKL